VDYTTSGLENSLSYLLLVAALWFGWRSLVAPASRGIDAFLALLGVFLLATNRLDSLALTLPLAVVLTIAHARRWGVLQAIAVLVAASTPLVASTAFSLYYYGFPLPNTVYAKLFDELGPLAAAVHGVEYVVLSTLLDPMLAIVVVGVWMALRTPSRYWRAVGAGIAVDVLAIAAIGGDFMAGRFLTLSVVAALFAVGHLVSGAGAARWLLVLLVFGFFPFHPLHPFADRYYATTEVNVADERAIFSSHSSLEVCARTLVTGGDCPTHHWVTWGRRLAQSDARVNVMGNIGFYGYSAGLDKIVVDELALADAFLARMPLRPGGEERVAHRVRRIPEGYLETLATGENRIRDPEIHDYYEKVKVLTQAPLRAPGRLATVLRFNLGFYDSLLEDYDALDDPHP
jgi:arabinofuranosyltransferase